VQYAQAKRNPGKHSVGFVVVVLIHVAVVYALVTGLARKVVDVIKQPLETKIIETPKPPPEVLPPVPPPPQLEAPPPPFIPPPEVTIQAPSPPTAISAVTSTPPAEAGPMTPMAPPAPPPSANAGPVNVRSVCTKMPPPELPAVNAVGTVSMLATLTIVGGRVNAVEVSQIRGTNDRKSQRALVAAVQEAARRYACSGDAVAVQEFLFNIN